MQRADNSSIVAEFRSCADAFEQHAQQIDSRSEPYPWQTWGADSTALKARAGRVILRGIKCRLLDDPRLADFIVLRQSQAETTGDHWPSSPGSYAEIFERCTWLIFGYHTDDDEQSAY